MIIPTIWTCGEADDAADFYVRAFTNGLAGSPAGDAGAASFRAGTYPSEGLPEAQENLAGQTLTVFVDVTGPAGDSFRFQLINAVEDIRPNPSISFILNFDPLMFGGDAANATEVLDTVWAELNAGGRVLMPLQEYPFSSRFGWVEDRFGVSWQLMLTDPEGDPRPFITPALQFGGSVFGDAEEARELYVQTFPESSKGVLTPRPDGGVLFADAQLAGQWFAFMDSDPNQEHTFSYGVSLEVYCADQDEIDHIWDALSARPEEEMCGWLMDRFGVSWSIVPRHMGELMGRPGAFHALLGMKKIVIAEFP